MLEVNKKQNILVSGGAGFLGSNLIKLLLDQGDRVICVDNLSTGSDMNIKLFSGHNNFEFIQHDICSAMEINRDIDQIYNLASLASPFHYQNNPIETTKTSIIGSINLLELACKKNATILQASTSEVYGDPKVHPQYEEYWGNVNPIGLRACYDEGKRCAESLFFDYWRQKNVSIKIARIFNTFGPNMQPNDGRVVSNFIVQAIKGIPITIYGDGTQTRSFCYVDDMVRGFQLFMNSAEHIRGPINLGNPHEYKMTELANIIIAKTGSNSELHYQSLPEDDPVRRLPDITKARNTLKWSPEVDLDSGLEKTIVYFKRIMGV